MVWISLLSLAITIFGYTEAFTCLGHFCSGSQFCQIHLHQQTGTCYTHHGQGQHESHQQCVGSHHGGDHCFCLDQSCVDEMQRYFSKFQTTTTTMAPVIVTQPLVTTSQATVIVPQAPITTSQVPPPTTIAVPVHIEAIQCFGTTCYTPDACRVVFVNSVPVSGKCVSTVQTPCVPFPALGECDCDSSFCMSIVNTMTTTSGSSIPTVAPASTTPGTTPILTCADTEDSSFNCKDYNNQYGLCTSTSQSLQTIAKTRCPKYCNICGTGATPTKSNLIGTTTLPPCVDHDSRCALPNFKKALCNNTNPDTHNYAISTCAKSCNLCQEYIASLTVSGVCNVCGDKANFIPCSTQEINSNITTKCSSGKQYCMTDLYQDSAGNKDVYKRCVDDTVCQTKWLTESADQDYCSKYGQILNPSNFECHFCCIGDDCNTGILPAKSTLVAKPSGK